MVMFGHPMTRGTFQLRTIGIVKVYLRRMGMTVKWKCDYSDRFRFLLSSLPLSSEHDSPELPGTSAAIWNKTFP